LDVIDKIEDEKERALIKQMLADALNCMQQCEDHIKQFKLNNQLLFSDPHQD
jgi:phage shock protein A